MLTRTQSNNPIQRQLAELVRTAKLLYLTVPNTQGDNNIRKEIVYIYVHESKIPES